MRTDASAALLTSIYAASSIPYINLVFTHHDASTRNYSSDQVNRRILSIEHHEEMYYDWATIVLWTTTLADAPIPDFLGDWVEIGYGYENGEAGENTKYQTTPRLWVKSQQYISRPGVIISILELQGMWSFLREWLIRTAGTSTPYYTKEYAATDTVYALMVAVMAEAGITLNTFVENDSITNTYSPIFTINNGPFEDAGSILYRLISMTKSYLRPLKTLQFEVKYPQAGDAVNENYVTIRSATEPTFYTYMERNNLLIPNHIYLFADAGTDRQWTSIISKEAPIGGTSAEITKYADIAYVALAAQITVDADAQTRADVYLLRAAAEETLGRMLAPHDCRLELLDKITITDSRLGVTYPASNLTRVGGIVHWYEPAKGIYNMEVLLGGMSTSWADIEGYSKAVAKTESDIAASPANRILDVLRKQPPTVYGDEWGSRPPSVLPVDYKDPLVYPVTPESLREMIRSYGDEFGSSAFPTIEKVSPYQAPIGPFLDPPKVQTSRATSFLGPTLLQRWQAEVAKAAKATVKLPRDRRPTRRDIITSLPQARLRMELEKKYNRKPPTLPSDFLAKAAELERQISVRKYEPRKSTGPLNYPDWY